MLKHLFVSAFANLGVSVGMPSGQGEVQALINRLHPVKGGHRMIRIGSQGDGGYVVPDDFDGIVACFSPGVDDRASFESDLIARGIPCFLADASVAKAPVEHDLISFLPKFLGVVNDAGTITLETWVRESAPAEGDLVLQMDIEGAEWTVLLHAPDALLDRFRVIVLELHFLDRLLDREYFRIISATFARLLEHFAIVHNHPNNFGGQVRRGDVIIPRALEITLLRRDRVTDWSPATEFPHPLDRQNSARVPAVDLPRSWYG